LMENAHTTTGTERRPKHALNGNDLVFNLTDEIDALQQDLSRSSGHRSAKTLSKTRGLRLTLVVLEANAGGASLQVLDGRLRVQTQGQIHEVGPGQVAVLAENLHEPIQAAERTAFLVTVAWPEGAGAWA